MNEKKINSPNTEMPINGNLNNSRIILPSESKESKMIPYLIAKSILMRN
jgi:hypothetical protein